MTKPELELKLFLEQHPHLMEYQVRLNKAMNSVPEEHRLLVLSQYISWNLEELNTELEMLKATIQRIVP